MWNQESKFDFHLWYLITGSQRKKYYVSCITLERSGYEATLGEHPLMSFLRKNMFLRAFQMHKMSIWVTSVESVHQACQNQPIQWCWLLSGTGLWSHFSLRVHEHFQHSLLVYLGWMWTKVWAPNHSESQITRPRNAEKIGLVFKILQKYCRAAPEQRTLHPIHPEAYSTYVLLVV